MSSNEMLVAGLLSALGLGVAGHNAIQSKKRSPRAVQGRKRQTGGSNTMYPVNRQDLTVKPPDPRRIPRSVPRNVASLMSWDTVKSDITITTSTSAIVETNFQFSLQAHPQYSSWVALFDQYHIAQVSVTFRSKYPSGVTFAPAVLYTALDFDSAGPLGSVSALEDFSSCELKTMGHEATLTRTVKPCVKSSVYNTNAGTAYSAELERCWIDTTSATNIGHYGIRSILTNSATAYDIVATLTIWFAFRNQV